MQCLWVSPSLVPPTWVGPRACSCSWVLGQECQKLSVSSLVIHPRLCLLIHHSASRGPGVTDVASARCAKMALQIRHTIPPLILV